MPASIEYDGVAVMIRPLEMAGEADIADIFPALRRVGGRNFVLRENGGVWALWHARATIDTGVGVDIDPGPLAERLTRDHAFDRANINTTAIANA